MMFEAPAWTTATELAFLELLATDTQLWIGGRRKPVNTDRALRNYAATFWQRKRFCFDPTVVAAWLGRHGYTVPLTPCNDAA